MLYENYIYIINYHNNLKALKLICTISNYICIADIIKQIFIPIKIGIYKIYMVILVLLIIHLFK